MKDAHAGDKALESILRRLAALYSAPERITEELLAAYIKPRQKGLQQRKDETQQEHILRVLAAFSGAAWILTRRRIAKAFTEASAQTVELINAGLAAAFADGLNEAAYTMKDGIPPVTEYIVHELAKSARIKLPERKLKRNKDLAYNEKRTDSALHSAILAGVAVERLAKTVAKAIANARKAEAEASARAYIYSASDSGAYFAGQEAAAMGVDVEKTWLSIMDMRVRPSHKHLHNTTVPLDGLFHGYHGDLRYPHDPQAVPAETYRCRCRMVVHAAGKAPHVYGRELLPTQTAAYMKWRDEQIKKSGGELEVLKWYKQRR